MEFNDLRESNKFIDWFFRLFVGWEFLFGFDFGIMFDNVFEVEDILVGFFPDLHFPHGIDDIDLLCQIHNEDLDGLNSQNILQLLHIFGLVGDFDQIFVLFFVVDPVNAVCWELNLEGLQQVEADTDDTCAREGLQLQ